LARESAAFETPAIAAILHRVLCDSAADQQQKRARLLHRSARSGLERLLRYRARSSFALERLEQLGDDESHRSLAQAAADGTIAAPGTHWK